MYRAPDPLAPRILFARTLATARQPQTLAGPAHRASYVLVEQMRGRSHLVSPTGETILPPGRSALCQPGTTIRISTLAQARLVAFDLLPRPEREIAYRSANDDGRMRMPMLSMQATPQPSWSEAFAIEVAMPLPVDLHRATSLMLRAVCDAYWVDPLRYRRACGRLHTWTIATMERLAQPQDDVRGDVVERASAIMRARCRHGVTVGDAAAALGISRSRLSELFRRRHGIAPGEYIDRLQLRLACRELATGRLSLAQVAELAGMSNAVTLCRRFRRFFGMTPGQWATAAQAGEVDAADAGGIAHGDDASATASRDLGGRGASRSPRR